MKKSSQRRLLATLALAIATGLAGCGSGEKITAPTSLGFSAIDGYLSGMFCYADMNSNKVYDQSIDIAATSLTDAKGNFTITGVGIENTSTICRAEANSRDQSTGETFSGQLSAPPGSKHVTPVTTLIMALGGDSTAEASVRSLLGLDNAIDLKADPLSNPALAKAAAKIQAIVAAVTNAISQQTGATQPSQKNAIAAEAFKAIAKNVTGQSTPLSDTVFLNNIINDTTAATTGSTSNDESNNLGNALVDIMNNIDSEYDSVITQVQAGTLSDDELENALNNAQSNSSSNSQLETAFTNNGVNLTSNSLQLNGDLNIDESDATIGSPTKALYSSNGYNDPETFAGEFPLSAFDSGASFDASVTTDNSFDRVFSVASGTGYGKNIALAAFVNYSPGFLSAYDTFKIKVKGSPSNKVKIAFFTREGVTKSQESAVTVDLSTYENANDIGNGWYEVSIPFYKFSNNSQANLDLQTSWYIRPTDELDTPFTFYFTDVELAFEGQVEPVTPPSTLLISNGDFSNTTAGWSGNAFNVVDGANFANVTSAGNPYDVNLSNVTTLEQGQTYTLSFKAKGTAGRTMIAGVGLNENPYTSATETTTLTSDYQTFTYTFSNIAFGGANSRVLFDLGADTGEVFIDDVTLVKDVAQPSSTYQLVWSNEFDTDSLANWNIETGYGPNSDGWGNDESQLYTNDAANVSVANGDLVITAKCDLNVDGTCGIRNDAITSARLNTKDKVEFRYGKIEARIKVPAGMSTWPAFWMLGAAFPDTQWPDVGEMDIMEVWQTGGASLNQSNSTIHYSENAGHVIDSGDLVLTDSLADDYHIWALEWTETSLAFSIDGQAYKTIDISDAKYAAFKQPFFLLLNIAIDGTLGGAPDAIINTPQKMLVDYVKLYQDASNTNNLFTEANATPQALTLTVKADNASAVRMTGPFWGWDPAGGPEATDNGDGTWTVTLDPAPTADMEYLWVVDGVQENLTDNANPDYSCTPITDNATYANRQWTVGSANVTDDIFDSCAIPLTLTVSANNASAVRMTGPFWGWDPAGGPEATDNGDGTWTVTLDPAPTADMEYLWVVDGVQENLTDNANPDYSCTPITDNATYANRQWTVGSANVTDDIFDSCAIPLTLTVSANNASAVRMTGPFWGWDPAGGPEATDNGDGTWTVTLDPAPTADMEYLWVVDGTQENLLDNSPQDLSCTPVTDNANYANRQWLLDSPNITGDVYDSCQP
ncbi:family 16 glycosylhydrolase [Thiomicrorhabdus sp. Milos-T2]|uniref:family 16 glycosylhydrolase n=1 Tax=Thiomicrorhabdus sp. Milos-T2 TaxID=90814 RepID=UPI00069106FF|nr:family 16 glycosylhydrolase [Thiomicrorhabdus sp. Milos-T2]